MTIYEDLMEVFDGAAAPTDSARWQRFCIAVLELALESAQTADSIQVMLNRALAAWRSGTPDEEFLDQRRVDVWRYFQHKNGDSTSIRDAEDRALRVALGGLNVHGNRDDAIEVAGWVEDFLTGQVDR